MVAIQETLAGLLHKFNTEHKVRGSAVVTRDGLPMASSLPASVDRETFAAMIATMVGAAETAAFELETTAATQVLAEFHSLSLVAVGAGPDLIFVTIGDGAADTARLADAAAAFATQIQDHLGAKR